MAAASFFGPTAHAQDPCKPVRDAAILEARTPSHVYSTMNQGSRNMATEIITTSSAMYSKTNLEGDGQWRKTIHSQQDEAKEVAEHTKSYTGCQLVGNEEVNGEAATVYSESNTESLMSGKVWVSKKRGLPLRAEVTSEGRHISVRYEYDNIQPPAGLQ